MAATPNPGDSSDFPELSIRSAAGQRIDSLTVLIPVYNSEGTIGRLVDEVLDALQAHFSSVELVLVNDGSRDASHDRILEAQTKHPGRIRYVQLARNFGEHNALMCGLKHATGDAVVIIDDDFQNPPGEIVKIVDKLREGYDAVYSYYEQKHHHFFRNLGSAFNDRMATWVLKKPKGLYLSSFKAMNRFLVDTVSQYDGPYPYIDGLILRSTNAIGRQLCAHAPRAEGKSNYTLAKLVRLWLNMFTSFSVVPLRISSFIGFCMAIFGIFLSIFYVFSWFYEGVWINHEAFPPGWASTVVSITVFGGIQLCLLGMVGEYLGRVFMTQNRQPQFVIRKTYGVDDGDAE